MTISNDGDWFLTADRRNLTVELKEDKGFKSISSIHIAFRAGQPHDYHNSAVSELGTSLPLQSI